MSRRIIRDIEEALAREVRRITFHDTRTIDTVVLEDTFDPFTGEIITTPVEPSFYDSSADANHIQYPHFFIRLLRSREDLTSGRVVSQYGRGCTKYLDYAVRGYEIMVSGSDAVIAAPGNTLETSIYNIRKILNTYTIKLLRGNNIGVYKVDSITPSAIGPHTVTVSDTLVDSMPTLLFDSTTSTITFEEAVDLNTVEAADVFYDSLNNPFPITSTDIENHSIVITGGSPDLSTGGYIKRPGNVFKNADTTPVKYVVMDPAQPVLRAGSQEATGLASRKSFSIPLDLYYLIRIDSKTKDNHVDTLNRMWEEFNPPRSGLSVVVRSEQSAEELLTEDVSAGGSSTIKVANNSDFNLNDSVFIIDDVTPSKDSAGSFESPHEAKIIEKQSTDTLVLSNTVPDTYTTDKRSMIVSNATLKVFMFHFVDHITRDIEGAQYWIHEFTFWVQTWIDKLEAEEIRGVIQDIATPIADIEGNVIIEDP